MNDFMKSARLHAIGKKLSIDRTQIPHVGNKEVLVKIKASGLCHSDLNYRKGISPVGKLPITLGHEISGDIVEIGDQVAEINEGDRVCVHYVISCGNCSFCNSGRDNLCKKYKMIGKDVDGGFAEYITLPLRNVLKLPPTLPYEQGAIMGCALSTSFHALKRGRIRVGDSVIVYGVGGVGIHAVQLAAKVFGAGKVVAVDLSEEKLKLAKKLGADETVNASEEDPLEKIKEITDGELANIVLEFIGLKQTMDKAISCIGKGGKLIIVGISPDEITISPYRTVIARELEIIGVNDHLKSEMDQLMTLVNSGKLDLHTSITHKVPLDDVNLGFELLERKIGNPVRVVLVQ
jgi:propanol-preferring alcohol dehydrogenase